MRDERYPERARESLRLMVAEKGFLEPFDPTGANPARQGVLVRHLVLPGHVDNTRRALDWLREEFGRWLPLSLMSQYQPTPAARRQPPFDRPLARHEYDLAVEHAENLGFENILIQPAPISDDFFPDFSRRKPFKGNPD
jgi:putative pyruvate formate lyase activating enzyme